MSTSEIFGPISMSPSMFLPNEGKRLWALSASPSTNDHSRFKSVNSAPEESTNCDFWLAQLSESASEIGAPREFTDITTGSFVRTTAVRELQATLRVAAHVDMEQSGTRNSARLLINEIAHRQTHSKPEESRTLARALSMLMATLGTSLASYLNEAQTFSEWLKLARLISPESKTFKIPGRFLKIRAEEPVEDVSFTNDILAITAAKRFFGE